MVTTEKHEGLGRSFGAIKAFPFELVEQYNSIKYILDEHVYLFV